MPFYAVRKGRRPGIYRNWDECKAQVDHFQGCQFKKFNQLQEAEAFLVVEKPPHFKFTPVVNNFTQTVNNFTPEINSFKPHVRAKNATNRFAPYAKPTTKVVGNNNNNNDGVKKNGQESAVPSVAKFIENVFQSSHHSRHKTSQGQFESNASQFASNLGQLDSVDSGQFVISDDPGQFASNSESNVDAVVYTDGCCTKNGSRKARAGLGVYWAPGHPNNLSDRVRGRQTNNCAEIEACCRALQQAKTLGLSSLEIRTDSQFLIDCVTRWMPSWKKKGWKTRFNQPVKNKVELMQLDQCRHGIRVVWTHVAGHAGIEGNEEADRLAKEGAAKKALKKAFA